MAAGTVVAGRWELFVTALAHRIARFPAAGQVAIKERINAITLAPADDFRRDSDLFGEQVHTAEAQRLIQTAMQRGLQTRDAEMDSPACSVTWAKQSHHTAATLHGAAFVVLPADA